MYKMSEPSLHTRIDALERRFEALEARIAQLTTSITCANGEVYVTGPLNVSIQDPGFSHASMQTRPDLPCRIRS